MTSTGAALVGDAYEESAARFARSAHELVYAPLARPLVSSVLALCDGSPRLVLDLAAGIGAFGQAFRRVVAADLSTAMLAANPARRRVCADAEHLPFAADSFSAAGCAFGINHVAHPGRVIVEMARVAPIVGVTTWLRPEPAYAPKRIVNDALTAQVGSHRSEIGRTLDERGDRVGTVAAVTALLGDAGLEPSVRIERIELPWPGVDAYLDYRLGMPSTARPTDLDALRTEVARRVAALPAGDRTWAATIIVGTGRRVALRPPRAAWPSPPRA